MSDYLNNLVARTLETAPLLQPRRLSLFEPVGGVWGMESKEWGVEETGTETAVLPQSQPVMPPPMPAVMPQPESLVAPMHPPVVTAAPPPTAFFHQPAASQPASTPPAPVQRKPSPPAQPARPTEKPTITNHTTVLEKKVVQQTIEQQIVKPPAVSAPPGTAELPRRPAQPAVTSPELAADTTAVAPALAPPATPPPPIKPMPPVVEKRPLATAPTKATNQEPLRPATSPAPNGAQRNGQPPAPAQPPQQTAPPLTVPKAHPAVAPPFPSRPARWEQSATSRQEVAAPAPTIEVHIGRIEVRATPPPPPANQKSRPQPKLTSLDDYLRQRNGGDR